MYLSVTYFMVENCDSRFHIFRRRFVLSSWQKEYHSSKRLRNLLFCSFRSFISIISSPEGSSVTRTYFATSRLRCNSASRLLFKRSIWSLYSAGVNLCPNTFCIIFACSCNILLKIISGSVISGSVMRVRSSGWIVAVASLLEGELQRFSRSGCCSSGIMIGCVLVPLILAEYGVLVFLNVCRFRFGYETSEFLLA
ncbi:hypothetical protein BDZ91DRAFT_717230 [Kalaharituber pfeilii]|nr:hypothetical protein BDZ91DRAFT_717230 [Kalaharituber pfeilii]